MIYLYISVYSSSLCAILLNDKWILHSKWKQSPLGYFLLLFSSLQPQESVHNFQEISSDNIFSKCLFINLHSKSFISCIKAKRKYSFFQTGTCTLLALKRQFKQMSFREQWYMLFFHTEYVSAKSKTSAASQQKLKAFIQIWKIQLFVLSIIILHLDFNFW